jgi:hypothetical protein
VHGDEEVTTGSVGEIWYLYFERTGLGGKDCLCLEQDLLCWRTGTCPGAAGLDKEIHCLSIFIENSKIFVVDEGFTMTWCQFFETKSFNLAYSRLQNRLSSNCQS